MGSLGGGDKLRCVVAVVEAKVGTVFCLSETVKVQFMAASHGFVRSQDCCGRARQRTATSANLCLAFAMECFLSRKWWVGVGAAGKGIPIPIPSLCFGGPQGRFLGYILRLGGPHHREGKG